MKPHQQRVVDEKSELDERLEKLRAFLRAPIFQTLPIAEQGRLETQAHLMCSLSAVLCARIAAFE